jgi:type VI secretion system protein ImpJ
MKSLSRVVWSEGMHLGPHHFQAQSRYFEDLVDFTAHCLGFGAYGLLGCGFDEEAIRNGTIALLHARGIFPDGLTFDMPGSDALPAPRHITDVFPPTRTSLEVRLAVPPHNPNGLNCAFSEAEANGTRFIAESSQVGDLNTGRDEKTVKLGRKNIALWLDTEEQHGRLALPITRVMRDGSGHFIFDPSFVPPALHLSASDRLMMLVGRLIALLEQKIDALRNVPEAISGAAGGFSAQQIANAWLLHSVNTAVATLRHLWSAREVHPERLYLELARLGGALCTFALDSHPRQLPLYDHDHLAECFEGLDRHIRTHLEMIVPSNCVAIPLQPAGNYLYAGPIHDQRVLDHSRWIFGIRSSIGEVELVHRTSTLVKICSLEFIDKLVKRALPGLEVRHLGTPPAAVSPRVETEYFAVSKSGPCWEHIIKTRQVAVYIPGDIPQPEPQLLVILES